MDIVNTSHSLESGCQAGVTRSSRQCLERWSLHSNFEAFFFKCRFQDSFLPSLLTSEEEDSDEVTMGEEAEPRGPLLQGPFPLPGSWLCDCCLCLWCLQGKALRGGELHLGDSSPSKMNTNILCHDPPSCSTHSACLTQLAATARAQSTSASRLKCPFALGDAPGSWWAGAGARSFYAVLQGVSGKARALLTTSVGSIFLLIFLSRSRKLTRNFCCLAKQNGKLGCWKTAPCLCVGFCNDELILRRLKAGERGVCPFGKMAAS